MTTDTRETAEKIANQFIEAVHPTMRGQFANAIDKALSEERGARRSDLHQAVCSLIAEQVYENGQKGDGIAVRFLMRLHVVAYHAGLPEYTAENPVVMEALRAFNETEICPVCKDEVPGDSMLSYNNQPNAFCQGCVDSGRA